MKEVVLGQRVFIENEENLTYIILNYHEFENLDITTVEEDNNNENENSLNHINNNENS